MIEYTELYLVTVRLPDHAVQARITPRTCVLWGVADPKGNSVYRKPL
jgi:hypothetical protein